MSASGVSIRFSLNGSPVEAVVDARTTLLDFLREDLDLPGTKKGCDHGQCGSCTVILDGRRINSCLQLVAAVTDCDVLTVEGLGSDGDLNRLQRAFVERDAFQCGYCTPGQLCSAVGMLSEFAAGWPSAVTEDYASPPDLDEAEVRERMSGDLCRCAAYGNLVAGILQAVS
jgi:xanthine dehydrogenase YagT iron-sulfur-binding subunit